MFNIDPNQPYILEVPDVLSPEECTQLIQRIEILKPEIATINTVTGTEVNPNVRNNDRVIFDDPELAKMLLARVGKKAPRQIHKMSLVGANERFRCYRYKPGMQFRTHADGSFYRDEYEQSCYSFLVYLNEDFTGGATTFVTDPETAIQPKTGMGLLFQHPLMHEGSLVTSGVKYVARTDLMYRKSMI